PRAGGPHPLHGAGADPERQADLPLHVPAQERVHLLRERPPPSAVPARDGHHKGLRRRLEGRRRRAARLPDAVPNPITPPPQPTGRTENPSSCLFYCYCSGAEGRLRPPLTKASNVPIVGRPRVPLRNETVDNSLL